MGNQTRPYQIRRLYRHETVEGRRGGQKMKDEGWRSLWGVYYYPHFIYIYILEHITLPTHTLPPHSHVPFLSGKKEGTAETSCKNPIKMDPTSQHMSYRLL